ncbi:hypothetical protein B0H11DRAFT_2075194 [Mycena galericulata]|nr:hypothetical protein B0H11DRAFT_2075194 [Mycena galericulata]
MPLFKNHPTPANEPAPVAEAPARKGSMFSRRRSLSPAADPATDANANNATSPSRRNFFGRSGRASLDGNGNANGDAALARNGSVASGNGNDSVRSGRSGPGFFGRTTNFDVHNDPTILAAREKVTNAERAETEADRALVAARAMVREARDHVKFLEREAAAEAKRAQQKQAASNDVSKSAAGLGRHGT